MNRFLSGLFLLVAAFAFADEPAAPKKLPEGTLLKQWCGKMQRPPFRQYEICFATTVDSRYEDMHPGAHLVERRQQYLVVRDLGSEKKQTYFVPARSVRTQDSGWILAGEGVFPDAVTADPEKLRSTPLQVSVSLSRWTAEELEEMKKAGKTPAGPKLTGVVFVRSAPLGRMVLEEIRGEDQHVVLQ